MSSYRAFERMRYGYEPETKDSQFYIGDMPIILERVILEYRPEWGKLRRRVVELPDFDPQTGQPRDKGK